MNTTPTVEPPPAVTPLRPAMVVPAVRIDVPNAFGESVSRLIETCTAGEIVGYLTRERWDKRVVTRLVIDLIKALHVAKYNRVSEAVVAQASEQPPTPTPQTSEPPQVCQACHNHAKPTDYFIPCNGCDATFCERCAESRITHGVCVECMT